MASSNAPSTLEDKHLGYAGNKNDVKASTKSSTIDFINTETNRHNGTKEHQEQDSIRITNPSTPSDKMEDIHNQNNRTILPKPDETAAVNNTESIGSGLESDVEDNVNDNSSTQDFIVKEPDPSIDDNLPHTVTLLRTPDGGKCYLVGTAHFSIESQNDVSKVIQAVQPHVVMVELCLDRIHVLQLDEETILKEAKNLTFNKMMDTIKTHGTYKGIFYILLLNMSAHLTRVLGIAPGGEFRRAVAEAKKVPNCLLSVGDRPIKITFARALGSLTWWQTIKLAWHLLTEKNAFSQKDVEKYKCRDSIEEMMGQLAGEYPALKEVFVRERDIFLTNSLQLACRPRIGPDGKPVPARVVGIVGIGHSLGIVEHWGKVKPSQIPPILSIPPPSLSGQILKFTFKASMYAALVYGGYKLISKSAGLVQPIKSSVEGLLKVSGRQ